MRVMRWLPRFRRAYASLGELAERESWSREQTERWQLNELNKLWLQAIRNVDYYRDLHAQNGLADQFEDLDQFRETVPVLAKSYVRENSQALLSRDKRLGAWHVTSGSTGSPTRTYRSHAAHQAMLRTRYRFYHSWGVDFADRWVWIWGDADSLKPGWRGRKARLHTLVTDKLRNRIRLSPYDLRPETLRGYLDQIAAFQPSMIYSHSMSMHLLAIEAERAGFHCPSLKAIVLTTEPVRPATVDTVERAFNVPALAEYGSVECGFLAGTAEDRTLRVREDNALLETVARPDGHYDIVVTVLGNPCFPLIRYALGDRTSRPIEHPADGFSYLHDVVGRDFDLVVTGTGSILHGQIFEDILDKYKGIRRWRVVQDKQGEVQVFIEPEHVDPINPHTLDEIGARLRPLLEGYGLSTEVVEQLPRTASGKHRTLTSELGASTLQKMTEPSGAVMMV